MKKLMVAVAVAGAMAFGAGAIGIGDIGSTGIADDPNMGIIDRGDGTYALVFTNAQTTTFTFNSSWMVDEILVVGGGGAGGGDCGAGGGAGGLIYLTELEYNYRAGDSISLTVGAGGKGGSMAKGQAGAHSYLTLGADTYTAFGGGGGGQWGNGPAVSGAGGNTGSGAGGFATCPAGITTMDTSKKGYYAHDGGAGSGSDISGGGGGAGTSGYPSAGVNGGDGGDGLPLSITGAEVYYAAGGGGGAAHNCSRRSSGGKGGGGNGTFQGQGVAGIHATGYGCGGGGGGSSGNSNGGNGSDGIVVLLLAAAETGDRPAVKVTVNEQGANYFKPSVRVTTDGIDNEGAVTILGGWAENADDIVMTELASGVKMMDSCVVKATGLKPNATYRYAVCAVNANSVTGGIVRGEIELGLSGVCGQGGELTKIGGEAIHVFKNDDLLLLVQPVENARLLIVGGGGSGGGDCGGGGGAGGYVELDGVTLSAGEHAVIVGAGGTSAHKARGTSGNDSTFANGSTLYRALGGGGGGCYGSGDTTKGKDGGSGGAGVNNVTRGKSIQFSQEGLGVGHDGGLGNGSNVGGGGGGAGGPGADNVGNCGGAGGPGVTNDITGVAVVYAAGGGGGDCGSGGVGGVGGSDGVGGHGGTLGVNGGNGYDAAASTGSGGGGSCGANSGGYGGSGANGIVVVRYTYVKDLTDDVEPQIAFGTLAVDGTTVSVPYGISWPGKGKATCAVTLNYGPETNDLRYAVQLGAGKIGNEEAALENLIPGRKYYLRLTADNGETQGQSMILSVTIPDSAAFPSGIAAGQPVIAGTGDPSCVVGDAETASYAGTFAQYVEGTAVTFHYSLDGETWLSDAATVTPEGFSGEVDGLTPSTDYPFYFTAEAGGCIDRTQTKTFNSMGPAVLAPTVTVSSNQRTLSATGELTDAGAGAGATVRLWVKSADGDWTEAVRSTLTEPGKFTLNYDGSAFLRFGTTYKAKLTVENTSTSGDHSWSSESSEKSVTPIDSLTYTWTGGAETAEKLWTDPANWTPSSDIADRLGYPDCGSASAVFESGDGCQVLIDRAISVNALVTPAEGRVKFVFGVPMTVLENPNAVRLTTTKAQDLKNIDISVSRQSPFYRQYQGKVPYAVRLVEWTENGIDLASVEVTGYSKSRITPRFTGTAEGKATTLDVDISGAPGLIVICR